MRASGLAALFVLCCAFGEDVRGAECPEDSVRGEDGGCKCAQNCPTPACPPGERPVEAKPADPETPGSCCPLYDCKPSAVADSVSLVKMSTEGPRPPRFCLYEDKLRYVGEQWQSECVSCICEEDGVASCQATMCKSCENAIPPEPGECCPHCPPRNATRVAPKQPCQASSNSCALTCKHGFLVDENGCPVCSCAPDKENEHTTTERPDADPDACLPVPDCEPNCELSEDKEGCPVCVCQTPQVFDEPANDTVLIDGNGKKICPELKCDLHCERGLLMDENDCTFCKCRAPDSDCPPLLGCRKRCTYGYKTNKRGCPICRCRASCTDHRNETHPEGSTWHSNACTECTCQTGGRLSCRETICFIGCSNPLPPKPGTCCSICPIETSKDNEPNGHQGTRGWGTVPVTVIAILSVLCLLLIVHIVRSRFRGRLSPSETTSCSSYRPQYYKYVPAYDTPMHRSEKIVPL